MTTILQNSNPLAGLPRVKKPQPQAQEKTGEHPDEDFAVMRDTGWRYGGFADEMGEIFKPYLGEIGRRAGYVISGVYCLADLYLTAKQTNEKGKHLPDKERRKKVLAELFDLSVFHTVATMLIPPMIIGKAVSWTQKHLSPEHPFQFRRTVTLLEQGAASGWARERRSA